MLDATDTFSTVTKVPRSCLVVHSLLAFFTDCTSLSLLHFLASSFLYRYLSLFHFHYVSDWIEWLLSGTPGAAQPVNRLGDDSPHLKSTPSLRPKENHRPMIITSLARGYLPSSVHCKSNFYQRIRYRVYTILKIRFILKLINFGLLPLI